jgi:manganese/zinc/iron transport system permease protein
VGLILVVALMIGPPATAYLLTDRLPAMIGLGALFGIIAAVSGYWLAHGLDASIAGCIATMTGVLFGVVLLLAPGQGLIAVAERRLRQKWEFARTALAIHLFQHEGLPEAAVECRVDHLQDHLRWSPAFAARVLRQAEDRQLVSRRDDYLELTESGRALAAAAIVR